MLGEGVLLGGQAHRGADVHRYGPGPLLQSGPGLGEADGDGPLVVREKTHPAAPMSLDQALYEMELVGHDFFLFVEKDSGLPSVVYRRHGYHYGVIHLKDIVKGGIRDRFATRFGAGNK